MAATEPGEVWDQLAASLRQQGSTLESARKSGRVRLRLRPEPTVRHLPQKARSVAEIEPTLRQVIRRLVTAETPWPLFLHGGVGTGKTCAALALLDHADCCGGGQVGKGEYLTASDLAEQVIEAQQGRLYHPPPADCIRLSVQTMWGRLADAPLVVLDELGARERVSDHQYDCIKRLMDLREGRPFLAISNLDLETLAQRYDDRIASRLAAGTVCCLDGADRRLSQGGPTGGPSCSD